MNERENNEEIYLSPQSVSSRIKSLNDEIRSRLGLDEDMDGCSVHERTARRYKESLNQKVEDEPVVESRGIEESVIGRRVIDESVVESRVVDTPVVVGKPIRRTSSNTSSTGSIRIDSRLGTRFYRDEIHSIRQPANDSAQQRENKEGVQEQVRVQPQEGRVRDLVQDYSLKIPKNNKKNPFKKGAATSFPNVTTNPFFIKKKEEPVTSSSKPTETNSPFKTSSSKPTETNSSFKTSSSSPFKTSSGSPSKTPSIASKTPSVKDDLSILSQNSNTVNPNSPLRPIILTPINVLYSPKYPPLIPRKSTPSPSSKKIFNKTLESLNSYFGPGEELTKDITFSIVNTVYHFNKDVEDTIYYLRVESNTSWIIRKTLSQLKQFLKNRVLDDSYNPFDKKVRDNIILTILNTAGERPEDSSPTGCCTTEDLQYFILSNISKDKKITEKRSTFLLMGSSVLEPYNFRLVGQALVCYDKTNRVNRIFLLKGCSVEPQDEYSFRIISKESSVVLYCSCKMERDSWVEDIKDFIGCME